MKDFNRIETPNGEVLKNTLENNIETMVKDENERYLGYLIAERAFNWNEYPEYARLIDKIMVRHGYPSFESKSKN